MRNQQDLDYMSCPDKYKHIGDFHMYFNEEKKVPYLTIFVGGNHEASNVLNETFYGGKENI